MKKSTHRQNETFRRDFISWNTLYDRSEQVFIVFKISGYFQPLWKNWQKFTHFWKSKIYLDLPKEQVRKYDRISKVFGCDFNEIPWFCDEKYNSWLFFIISDCRKVLSMIVDSLKLSKHRFDRFLTRKFTEFVMSAG